MEDIILKDENKEYEELTNKVVKYLEDKYNPISIMVYGSYATFDYDDKSDFDCMIIVDKKTKNHDDERVGGVMLDCFIFTKEELVNESIDTFVTAYDGLILKDDGCLKDLKERVNAYVKEFKNTSDEEIEFIRSFIVKTIERSKKGDLESKFRLIGLLNESLADYFILRRKFYFGSKKSIKYLLKNDIYGFELFNNAVINKGYHDIIDWLFYVIEIE